MPCRTPVSYSLISLDTIYNNIPFYIRNIIQYNTNITIHNIQLIITILNTLNNENKLKKADSG